MLMKNLAGIIYQVSGDKVRVSYMSFFVVSFSYFSMNISVLGRLSMSCGGVLNESAMRRVSCSKQPSFRLRNPLQHNVKMYRCIPGRCMS